MCTEANTRLSSAEIVSSGNVSSGSRDTTRSILSSVRPARFNASQPATSGREVTMSIPTRFNFPSSSLNRTPHGDLFAFRSCQRVVSAKGMKKLIFAGRKLFHQGRHLQHTHDTIETGNVPALISGRHRTIARGWVKLISIHGHARHSRGT